MKIWNVEPGSPEWLSIRLGIPTASQMHRIVTPAKLDFSAQARKYAFQLVVEKLLNESSEDIDYIDHVRRGKEQEPLAVMMYEQIEGIETKPVGFITTDDLKAGASPDRLVGAHGALEAKCPAAITQVSYIVDGFGTDYIIQAQAQAYVGEFDFVDRYSFHPSLPPVLKRTERDDFIIGKLEEALARFWEVRDEIEEKVRAAGFVEERRHLITEADRLADDLLQQ